MLHSLRAQWPNDGRVAVALLTLHAPAHQGQPAQSADAQTEEVLSKKQQVETTKSGVVDFNLEDQKTEVHAHWVLGPMWKAKDITVRFQEHRLFVAVGREVLFDAQLAHRIRPSESSWTFATPDLTVTLCKWAGQGSWPRWEVLHKEEEAERLHRLGGLPFDTKSIHWL